MSVDAAPDLVATAPLPWRTAPNGVMKCSYEKMKEHLASLVIIAGLGLVISRLSILNVPPIIIGISLLLTASVAWVERKACSATELEQLWAWKLRRNAGVGATYCMLLPIADILSMFHTHGARLVERDPYLRVCTSQSISFSITYILFFFLATSESAPVRQTSNAYRDRQRVTLSFYILMSGMVGALFSTYFLPWLSWQEWVLVSTSVTLGLAFMVSSFSMAPESLSMAEAAIIGQALSAFLLRTIVLIIYKSSHLVIRKSRHLDHSPDVTVFMQVAVLCCLLVLGLVYVLPGWLQKSSLLFYTLVPVIMLVVALPLLYLLLQQDWISWLVAYIRTTQTKKYLFLYWSACLIGAVTLVLYHATKLQHSQTPASSSKKSTLNTPDTKTNSTITRKHFHVLAMCVMIPGLVTDVEITCLSLTCAFVVFLMLEVMRLCEIVPFGQRLESYLRVFVDEQDKGPLLLTPVYLLVGCALPLWFFPTDKGAHVCLYSGVLALGVGDAAASIIGSQFGQWHWFDTKKTVEGTLASFVAQCVVLQFLVSYELCLDVRWTGAMAAILLTSLLEAFTTQIDNLVLPFFMYCLVLAL